MAKRRKSKKSSLKGFITLLILVVGILYAVGEYYFPNKVHQAQIWVQEQISGATTTHSATDSGVVINDGELVPSNYYPNVNKKITVLKNIGYISGFSNELRVPLWVGYVATYPFKYNTV